ncbi:uncharacterized protein F4812DRAFT_432870 [Daldinia caldariorum]|uniref:uncharacterized protein n=1 Tax=Daldinia caldariorum TaxID=326644 RepID=UPI00200821B6|nr:uncharacterized protein F4812DRAFT_432870 [Daldinia caldariorum]KAI1466808.1 hypothetical protein F4812DRAFT_432870 [Daldinia caldariorum]
MGKLGAPSTKVPVNGHLRNGIWHCNCIPRLPAIQYLAKRETPNKGRSFYACRKDRNKENKCNFFLWTEDAHEREVNNVLTNSRSEAEGTPSRRPKKRQRTLHESITPAKEKRQGKTPVTSLADLDRMLKPDPPSPPSPTTQSSTMKGSFKPVKAALKTLGKGSSSDEDDESAHTSDDGQAQPESGPATLSKGLKRKMPNIEDYSDLSSGEEEVLIALANNSAQAKTKQRDAFSTPSGPRTLVQDGMATPLTDKPVRRVLFADPSSPTTPKRDLAATSTNTPSTSSSSHHPQQQQQEQQQQSAPATPGGEQGLTQEIMALLYDQPIDGAVRKKIRAVLDRHAARAKGLERGRDASRDAAKKAEARVAELTRRVAELENQRRVDEQARQKMRTELMKLYRES